MVVAIWVRSPDSSRRVDDGYLKFSDGRPNFDLSIISGQDWTRQKIQRLTNAMQNELDDRVPILSLPPDDLDRSEWEADPVAAAARLLSMYGGRIFYDGTDRVERRVIISFTFVNGDLLPHHKKAH